MLDYGIFYEFIPYIHSLWPVNRSSPGPGGLEQNYAVVISTNSGLWRYLIGDTVPFTSADPYRIIITGRTKQHINVLAS